MEILKLQNNHTSLGIHYFNAETLPFDSRVGTWVVALIRRPSHGSFFLFSIFYTSYLHLQMCVVLANPY